LEGRVKDYLERHGDFGRIDPEVLLYLNRQTYEMMEREKRIHPLSIGGTVWTSLGPTNGSGRLTAVAVHPTTAGTAIVGAAGGGCWKTTDSGATWSVLTDSIANLSVGAVAYAPSDANVVYLGTGEGGYAIDFIPGFGLLRSSTGGTTWQLPASVVASMFYRISVRPTNVNELVIGTNNGAQRTTTGDSMSPSWTQVINSPSAGATIGYGDVTDIVRDPSNELVLYATTWDRNYWCQRPAACGDPYNFSTPTVLKSTDGGANWSPAATGLPTSSSTTLVDRISLAIAPSSSSTLYASTAIYDNNTGQTISHVYKTTNSGGMWTETNLSSNASSSIKQYLGTQCWYDNAIVVSPTDPNTVLVAGVRYAKTTDGGSNWTTPTFTGSGGVHVDCHDMRYDSGGTLFIANDGGFWSSPDSGNNAVNRNTNLVTRQYYGLTNDPVNRNRVFGGMQDNGTNYRPDAGGTSWNFFTDSDGFQSALNERDTAVIYSTAQFGTVYRSKRVITPLVNPQPLDFSPRYDSTEFTPFFSLITTDPNNPASLYAASYRLWKSTTGGDAWSPLPITTLDASTWSTSSTVRSIAIAKSNSQIIMVSKGSNVFRSINGGTSWNRTISGLPGKTVLFLEIHPTDPNTVFAALAGTSGTSVYYTTNGGTSWSTRGTGLPSYSAQVVRYDPTDTTTLYCGTDIGVYRSTDGGANWSPFGTGLPAVSVYDVRATNDGSILRAATHGRGIWELTVTGNTNNAPAAVISTPASPPAAMAKGSTVSFAGTFTDVDPSDPMTATWFFPDLWSSTAAFNGVMVSHTFYRAGRWPVSITATDSHGAKGAANIDINILESGDSCSTPIVIPGSGPFPYTVNVNTETSTTQGSDPNPVSGCYPYTPQNGIWIEFTPAVTGTYTVSFCGSRASGVVAGFTGAACGAYTPIGFCFLNYFPGTDCSTDNTSTFPGTAGTTVRLFLTNYFTDDLGPVSFTISNAALSATTPVIAAVNPPVGLTAGATPVTITGSGFSGGATVSIGGVAATGVTVVDSGLITAVTGAHAVGTVDVAVTSGSTGTLKDAFTYASTAISAPATLLATASSTSQVNVSWTSAGEADHYDIYRRAAGGSFAAVASTMSPPFADTGRSADSSFLYKAKAIGPLGEVSADSNIDVATTTMFSDDPLVPGSTVVKGIHLTQMRTAVNAMETLAVIPNTPYADPSPVGVFIQGLHITQLRARLDAARVALGLSALVYSNTITAGVSPIRAIDFTEIRNGTK
jgi:hypothetical protein